MEDRKRDSNKEKLRSMALILNRADALVIGAGAGLSASAGFT